jgi:hypothetical protein
VGAPLAAVGGSGAVVALPLLFVGWVGSLPLAAYGYAYTPA